MSLGGAIYSKLTTANAAGVSTRVYPQVSLEDVYPLIVYDFDTEPRETLKQPIATVGYTLTIHIEALSWSEANAIAGNVKTLLDGSAFTANNTVIRSCSFSGETGDHYTDSSNPERIYYFVDQTYTVWAACS